MLNLLVADNGCVELTEIHRFTHPWEAHASTRLRAGDLKVLDLYEVQGASSAALRRNRSRRRCAAGWPTRSPANSPCWWWFERTGTTPVGAGPRGVVRLGKVSPEILAIGRDGNPIGWATGSKLAATTAASAWRGGDGHQPGRLPSPRPNPLVAHPASALADGVIAHLPAITSQLTPRSPTPPRCTPRRVAPWTPATRSSIRLPTAPPRTSLSPGAANPTPPTSSASGRPILTSMNPWPAPLEGA